MAKNSLLKFVCLTLAVVSLPLYLYAAFKPDALTHIYFFDVGQGDSMFIKTSEGARILIDGGPDATVTGKLARHLPFWDRSLDLVILTHPHADHVTGLVEVMERYTVKEFWYNGVDYDTDIYAELLQGLQARQIPTKVVKLGDQKSFGSLSLKVLHPFVERPDLKDPNDTSVTVLAEQGSFSALFTGDIGVAVEAELLGRALIPDIDVLKVAHQGSHTSSSQQFLEAAKPEVAEIMAGRDNSYGHPHLDVLARLESLIPQILRTDRDGDSKVTTDGVLYEVHR